MGILIKSGNGNVLGLVKAIMGGLQYVNDLFYAFYQQKKYEIIFTGQIIYMKRYLNDQFDPTYRRIYILSNVGSISPWMYLVSEGNGEYLYDVSEDGSPYLQRVTESLTDTDFTVYVPVALSYDSTQFNAAIRKYKLEDKTYTIQTY